MSFLETLLSFSAYMAAICAFIAVATYAIGQVVLLATKR